MSAKRLIIFILAEREGFELFSTTRVSIAFHGRTKFKVSN